MSRIMPHSFNWIAMALVLPSLLIRGVIPVGFMPMAGASGALEIALCPGTLDAATFIAASADPHAHHGHHPNHRAPPCPYALSATGAPPSVLLTFVPPATVEEMPRAAVTNAPVISTITRAHLPRGPPEAI